VVVLGDVGTSSSPAARLRRFRAMATEERGVS
jgi:hypothetical protein